MVGSEDAALAMDARKQAQKEEYANLTLKQIASGNKISRSLLMSDDAFVFDTGFCVYAWIGRRASQQERKKALAYAEWYLEKEKLPVYTPVARILEGEEPQKLDE